VNNIINPKTDEVIVSANELITIEAAEAIEDSASMRSWSARRSPATRAPAAPCWTTAWICPPASSSSRAWPSASSPRQSIGEPGTQLTMRTFHTGGIGTRSIEQSEYRARQRGHRRAA
jgi:DNA-directed RNA polymerase subunit beta'